MRLFGFKKTHYLILSICMQTFGFWAHANTPSTPNLPISHCYHWLDEDKTGKKFLSYKYKFAKENSGEFAFFTQKGNGAAAGDGIYCAKLPSSTWSYGDRVVRLDFVDDVVFTDTYGSKKCGVSKGEVSAACNARSEDVNLYDTAKGWYVIRSAKVIKSWSANSKILIDELEENKKYDATYASVVTTTINSIKKEIADFGGSKTYFNGKARMTLAQMLKDPSELAKVADISVLTMLSGSQGSPDISEKERVRMMDVYAGKLLANGSSSKEDIETALGSSKELETLVSAKIKSILKDTNPAAQYNYPAILAVAQKHSISVNEAQVKGFFKKSLLSTSANWASLTSLLTGDDKMYSRAFASAVAETPKINVDSKESVNALFSLINGFSSKSNKNLQSQMTMLTAKLLNASKNVSADIKAVYDAITNKDIEKEQVLLSIVKDSKDIDPMVALSLAVRFEAKLTPAQKVSLRKDFLENALVVSSISTLDLFRKLEKGQLEVPTFITTQEILSKLVERALQEQSKGIATTNLYRLILSEFYGYLVGKKDNAAAVKTFSDLSKWLVKAGRTEYAYATLQNASVFMTEQKYKTHALENILADYKKGSLDKSMVTVVDTVVPRALDGSVLQYLLALDASATDDLNSLAHTMLDKTMKYLASSEFKSSLTNSGFKVANGEKKAWKNFSVNPAFSTGGRYPSDICHFIAVVKANDTVLKDKWSADLAAADSSLQLASSLACQ